MLRVNTILRWADSVNEAKNHHTLINKLTLIKYFTIVYSDGVALWVARLTRNVEVVGSSSIKDSLCFLEQETLPLLLSTGWLQERIRAWFHNRTKIKSEGLMEDWLKCQISPSLNIVKTKNKPNYFTGVSKSMNEWFPSKYQYAKQVKHCVSWSAINLKRTFDTLVKCSPCFCL